LSAASSHTPSPAQSAGGLGGEAVPPASALATRRVLAVMLA